MSTIQREKQTLGMTGGEKQAVRCLYQRSFLCMYNILLCFDQCAKVTVRVIFSFNLLYHMHFTTRIATILPNNENFMLYLIKATILLPTNYLDYFTLN